eukprot:TRINITY_DN57806_c0_g2_i1.p3 TRINITY_DN57806_c0_g2~~TRINITY_DN57806_c0_g2_i1.p3  ORF type:complete len:113 (-),score=14.21 TRINITY_DN57806_c0_g2_i1:143-481(-)
MKFLFNGEEMLMLMQMLEKGWSVWIPPKTIVWHQWSRKYRHTFWKEVEGGVGYIGQASRQKVHDLMLGKDNEFIANFSFVKEILESLGINYENQTISDKSRSGGMANTEDFL